MPDLCSLCCLCSGGYFLLPAVGDVAVLVENPSMKTVLEIEINKLALLRQSLGMITSSVNKIEADTRREYDKLYASLREAKVAVDEQDAKVRELAIGAWRADPSNKKPAPGVAIRVQTKISLVYDATKAFLWAKRMKRALQLNVREFEEICKVDESRPKFVEKIEQDTPVACIDKELAIA